MAELKIQIPDGTNQELKAMFLNMAAEIIQETKKIGLSDKEFFNQKEACELLGISYQTLQAWRRKGLKIVAIDGKTIVPRSNIIQFLKSYEI